MGLIVKPFTFAAGATVVASNFNSCFDTIYTEFNGNIDNANIKAGANIDGSKIADGTILNAKLASNSIGQSNLNLASVKVLSTGAVGLKLARGNKAFTLVAGQATVTVTFSTDSTDGNPAFGATPIITAVVVMTTGTNVYRLKLTATSNTTFTFHVNSDSGADVQSGTVMWHAIGT